MNEKIGALRDRAVQAKNYFVEMPKKRKIGVAVVAALVILFAVGLTVYLNAGKNEYRVLYSNMEMQEALQVHQSLNDMGVPAQMDAQGNISVPAEQYDMSLLQLASQGYPKSGLAYDIFSNNAGMTATDADKQQYLIFQTNENLRTTLMRISGVKDAIVMINMAETTDYVWQQAQGEQRSSASVTLTLDTGVTLEPEQVGAIKTLVAASVPKLDPADVKVVDAGTGREMAGVDETAEGLASSKNLDLEQAVQKQIEDNIVRLLTPRYGSTGVVAAAKVTLDYDAMMTERMELQGKNEDNDGFDTHREQDFTINGVEAAGGIVGEEDNTDIPQYAYTPGDQEGGMSDYHSSVDLDYGYIKTQIEKGQAQLTDATVSVLVDEENMTDARRAELVALISNSANIQPEKITVAPFIPNEIAPIEPDLPGQDEEFAGLPLWAYIAIGVALLLILLIIILIIILRRRAAKKRAEQLAAEEAARLAEEQELEEYKNELVSGAKGDGKTDAIIDEVRGFAKENPEITASLLRNWLREEE